MLLYRKDLTNLHVCRKMWESGEGCGNADILEPSMSGLNRDDLEETEWLASNTGRLSQRRNIRLFRMALEGRSC